MVKTIKYKNIIIAKMKTNIRIFTLSITTWTVQSTKMNHFEKDKQLLMAQMKSKIKKQVHFDSDVTLKS